MKKITTLLITLVLITNVFSQTTTGLVAYYPLNGNITDAGPNAITGNNFGGTATTNKVGTANSAMNFANPNSTVTQYATHPVNANTSFGTNQNFTIAFACNIASLTNAGGLYDNNLNYGGPGLFAWNGSGFLQIQFNFKNSSLGTTNGAISLSTWYHITAVRNGSSTSIYINGVLNATGATGSVVPSYSYPARLGSMLYGGFTPPQYNGLNGKLDELRIYDRALTTAEILVLSQRALPIKLTSFTATQKNNDVLLQWQTAQEANTKHYLVQRSTDGISFNNINTTLAAGNTVTTSNYSYKDNTAKTLPNNAVVYYRLQSIDFDGKTQYSPVVSINLTTKKEDIVLLQNPIKDNIGMQITLQQKQQVFITVSNSTGQQIKNIQQVLPNGKTTLAIPVTQLSKGMYYITVHYNNTTQTLKALKN